MRDRFKTKPRGPGRNWEIAKRFRPTNGHTMYLNVSTGHQRFRQIARPVRNHTDAEHHHEVDRDNAERLERWAKRVTLLDKLTVSKIFSTKLRR